VKKYLSGKLVPFAILVLAILFVWCARAVEVDFGRLVDGRTFIENYFARMWPPNFEVFDKVWDGTVQTIELAFVATVVSFFVSLPFGFLGANNVMRTPFERSIAKVVRFGLNANRAIDSIILGMIFVSAVGLGPFAGTLALAIHGVGMLGKMFFEKVEGVDKGPVEALEASGASRLQVLRWAVVPQALPYFLTDTLLRFELNIRSAVVLGIVGAGGIGFLLTEYMRLFQARNVATVLLTILVLVMSIDAISGYTRRKLL
jgi:phosphonate transport system permease protein